MRKVIYTGRVIEVTPGKVRLTRKEFFKSRIPEALKMIGMFALLIPIALGIVSIAAETMIFSWQMYLAITGIMTFMGCLTTLGLFIDQIPLTEEDVDAINLRLYNELKGYYDNSN